MFVAFTPVGAPSLQKSTKVKIADAVGRNAMWSRGGRAVLCTPSQDRIDTAVTHSDEGLTAIHGDAYIGEEPLDTALFREIDDYGEINGEFSGVMVTKPGLRVVTDRLNLRQLFVYRSPKAFVAASSVRAVLAFLDDAGLLRTVSLNRTAIAEFLDSGHLLGTKTHFEGIELLPGGTTLDVEIDDGEMSYSEDSYWQPEYGQYYETREEAVEAVADAIRSAVDLRIDSDLRIGVHLSGGMDSRLFLAAASEETELTAYTFGVPYNDEAAIARFLAKISGHDVVCDELEGGLADYAKTGILRTDGHASIRHFHHIPTMDSLVGECDRLFIGSSGGVVFGGSKLTESMFDGTFDAAELHKRTSQFDRELWKAAFGPVGEFDSTTVRSSFEETFEGIDVPTTANRSDIWNLQNRQQRLIFQAGPRSVNYYLPVSNPLVADSRVINAWLRIPPQMRLEGIRPDLLSTLDRKMAYVPTAGTWETPAIPRLKYITGGLRLAASSKRLRSSLPGVETTDPFGYPDYAEWLRIDEHLGALVSTAVESFGERAWAVADELMGAYKSHQRGEADYHEELFILTTLELWLEHVFEEYPELAIESGESM